MKKPRALVTPFEMIHCSTEGSRILEAAGMEVVFPPRGIDLYDADRLAKHLAGVDCMLAGMEPLNAAVLRGSSLRAVARFGVGYDAIDIPVANELNIAVAITPGVNQVSVAEHTIALILAVYRQILFRHQTVQDGSWKRPYFPRLEGKTLGLVGLGRIGKEVVPRAKAFGLKVLAFDPLLDRTFVETNGIEGVEFPELLRRSDIVSLHMPCSPATDRLIQRDTINLMKDGAVLINTARGGLVDEADLEEALRSGKLWGAGLDAFRVEPPAVDHPLLQLKNVVLTPHTAGLDLESVAGMGAMAAQWLVDLYQGKSIPSHCLVSEDKPNWKW